MAINWNQIPLEMRQAIVREIDLGTRVNLSMCSRSDNQLVRGTKHGKVDFISFIDDRFIIYFDCDFEKRVQHTVAVESRDDGGSNVYVNALYSNKETYSTTIDWKETIWNIMSLIGTRVTLSKLELKPGSGFQERFNWLRNNFQTCPKFVGIRIYSGSVDYYDESIFDWPLDTNIELRLENSTLPNFQRFNVYDKIYKLIFLACSGKDDLMTDEELKKWTHARDVQLYRPDVTINGFEWWMRKWLAQKEDNEYYQFSLKYKDIQHTFCRHMIWGKLGDVCGHDEVLFDETRSERYLKIKIMKNAKVGGAIKMYSDGLIFESDNHNPAERNEQDAEMDNNAGSDGT